MRCKQCNSTFRFSSWILQCGECKEKYCTKCMTRLNGICYCSKCSILITRPPDPHQLMGLKPKELQEYLKRHYIQTRGLIEKKELVDLLCAHAFTIPIKTTKGSTVVNKIFSNFESTVLQTADRLQTMRAEPPFASASTSNISDSNVDRNSETSGSNTLPRESRPTAPPTEPPEPSPAGRKVPNLAQIENVVDLEKLSGIELKMVLSYYRVDYKGCVEKRELLEKVERLWEDKKNQKGVQLADNVEDLCKLCMDAPLDCVLLECGHIATCIDCGKKLAECPICRQYVSRIVRTFKA